MNFSCEEIAIINRAVSATLWIHICIYISLENISLTFLPHPALPIKARNPYGSSHAHHLVAHTPIGLSHQS